MSKVARIALAALSVGLCAVAGFATPRRPWCITAVAMGV